MEKVQKQEQQLQSRETMLDKVKAKLGIARKPTIEQLNAKEDKLMAEEMADKLSGAQDGFGSEHFSLMASSV